MPPLPRVDPEVSVQLVRPCKFPGAAGPGAEVGLVSDVPAQVGPQVRGFLVDLAAVGVVAQVHGGLARRPRRVHAERAPALLTLPPTGLLWGAQY